MMRKIFILILILPYLYVNGQIKPILQSTDKYVISGKLNKSVVHAPNPQSKVSVDYIGKTTPLSVVKAQRIAASGPLKGSFFNSSNLPKVISGQLKSSFKSFESFPDACNEFISKAKYLMEITQPQTNFELQHNWVDDENIFHARYREVYNNVPIYGAEIMLHGKNQKIQFLNGNYYSDKALNIETVPVYSLESSRQKIVQKESVSPNFIEKYEELLGEGFQQWHTELVIYPKDDQFLLAWHIQVYPNLGTNKTFIIDARDGDIISEHSNICKFHTSPLPPDGSYTVEAADLLGISRTINTYSINNVFYMLDVNTESYVSTGSELPSKPVGGVLTIDANHTILDDDANLTHVTSTTNTWDQNTEAVSAHYNAVNAFNYFRNVHGRNSMDNLGSSLISIVNVLDPETNESMDNAFWNGRVIAYGNGDVAFKPLGRALDVAVHEMSHGVVQHTANLVYQNESGALNESFADIFGVMADRDDWTLGEEVVNSQIFPSGALRSMQDPHNGATQGNNGWQPKHMNEKYTGNQDNGGVHINSGITNHAFYLFATTVGKDIAEEVYYRALTTYLTRSSNFVDLRIAVIQSATDLYNETVVNSAKSAFDQVGILGDSGGNYQQDAEQNTGQQMILFADEDLTKLTLINIDGSVLANPLSDTDLLSKPSVSDDGSEVVFVGADHKLHYIFFDWETGGFQESLLSESAIWRNVVISKDGNRIAALTLNYDNIIAVYDFTVEAWNEYTLFNPTFTEGVETGDVVYADAIEFDFTGNHLVYDAINRIESAELGTYEYWDIGFLNIWNAEIDSWALGQIFKLFSALPQGISVGNPSFSKNSSYIMALDYIEDEEYAVLGANIENGDLGLIYDSNHLAYPNYSVSDEQLIFDAPFSEGTDIGVINLESNKIVGLSETAVLLLQNSKWGTWFSNGKRDLVSSLHEIENEPVGIKIFPNPIFSNKLFIEFTDVPKSDMRYEIYGIHGQKFYTDQISRKQISSQMELFVGNLPEGIYILKIDDGKKRSSFKFTKI